MSDMTHAKDDSNALSGSGNKGKMATGDPAKDGYSEVPYPTRTPATSNVGLGVVNSVSNLGQDGTSAGAYLEQPKTVDSVSPKV